MPKATVDNYMVGIDVDFDPDNVGEKKLRRFIKLVKKLNKHLKKNKRLRLKTR